jgi:hypothetical protein
MERSAYQIRVGKAEGKRQPERPEREGRIIIKEC